MKKREIMEILGLKTAEEPSWKVLAVELATAHGTEIEDRRTRAELLGKLQEMRERLIRHRTQLIDGDRSWSRDRNAAVMAELISKFGADTSTEIDVLDKFLNKHFESDYIGALGGKFGMPVEKAILLLEELKGCREELAGLHRFRSDFSSLIRRAKA